MASSNKRQDYIARVRYQNDLPPPPCPPKLLDVPINIQKLTSWAFLSDLVRKQDPNMYLDMDLGMPLDMTIVPGIFDREDESGCYPLDPLPPLDPRDTVLLKDPEGGSSGARGPINVSFLRRTEYISSEVVRQKVDKPTVKKVSLKIIDPEAQLRAVEDTFEAANTPLEKLYHPKNKNLKPVASFDLLPDFKQLDLTYLSVKMMNSASLSHLREKQPESSLSTSLFRPTSLDTDEWMSFFVPTESDARELKRKLDNPSDKALAEDGDSQQHIYKFKHLRDYEMELVTHSSPFDEIAINFSADSSDSHKSPGVAWFVPIAGRTNLKRRRVDDSQRQLVVDNNVSEIELSLRELNSNESISRDNLRAEFDSVSYMATEE